MPTLNTSGGGSSVVAYAFTVNFIVGAGVLGLPHAFAKAGYLISIAFLIFISCIAVLTIFFTVEVIARADAWYRSQETDNPTSLLIPVSDASAHSSTSASGATSYSGGPGGANREKFQLAVPSMEITNLQLEVNELCTIFLGPIAGKVYELSIFFYVFGSLWLYAVIFASTLSSAIPVAGLTTSLECDVQDNSKVLSSDCRSAYQVWIGVYALISLFFTSRELSSQKVAQVTLTCLALFGILTIVGVTLGLLKSPPPDGPPRDATEVEWDGFPFLCTAAMFSQNCHYGIPSLVQLMGDRKSQRKVFAGACATTCFLYCALSGVCSYYWGSTTESLITLNYKHYRASYTDSTAPGWVYPIEYFVICFPAILVTTAFPLNAIALANNLRGFFTDEFKHKLGSTKTTLLVRALAAVPPLIAAFVEPNASVIITGTGMFAFILTFWAPCILFISSKKQCIARWGLATEETPYSWHFSHDFYAYAVLAFSFAAFVFTVINLIHPLNF